MFKLDKCGVSRIGSEDCDTIVSCNVHNKEIIIITTCKLVTRDDGVGSCTLH